MQLILAIEPDRRQADRITAMVRTHLTSAELVIAGSTSNALKALGERVPDLILTPALLPPADDTMLAERLRELGHAAAHIQAVTIPILSDGSTGADRERGLLLSALRRDRSREPESVGCEPAVFSKQIASYLQRAAQEREAQARVKADAPEPATVPQPAADPPQPASESDSDLNDWLDIDQVMAAIGDPPPSTDQRTTTPAAAASPASSQLQHENTELIDLEDPIALEPVDDKWEFFDPRQAAFPALLTKLNAIANADHAIN
jgi:CheY-like chemotaxis protein